MKKIFLVLLLFMFSVSVCNAYNAPEVNGRPLGQSNKAVIYVENEHAKINNGMATITGTLVSKTSQVYQNIYLLVKFRDVNQNQVGEYYYFFGDVQPNMTKSFEFSINLPQNAKSYNINVVQRNQQKQSSSQDNQYNNGYQQNNMQEMLNVFGQFIPYDARNFLGTFLNSIPNLGF